MSVVPLEHPSDEMLEMYALNQIGMDDLDAIEEHLLLCRNCQDRYLDTEQYIGAMKEACRTAHLREKHGVFGGRWNWAPTLGWAGGVLAGVLGVVLLFPRVKSHFDDAAPAVETEVQLSSYRGQAAPDLKSGRIRLLIETAELPAYPRYQVSVFSQAGQRLGKTEVDSAPKLAVPVDLRPGTYWVRVEQPGGAVLREFSLSLK